MNTAVPIVCGGWVPKYGLQESSRLTPSDRLRSGDGRTAGMGPVSGRPACSRPHRPLPSRSLACAVSFGCLSFQCFPFLVCTSCRGREATPPVDAAWLASNGSNPATFTADGLYLPRLQTELAYRLRRTADGNGRLRFLQRTCKIGLFQHFFGIYQSF